MKILLGFESRAAREAAIEEISVQMMQETANGIPIHNPFVLPFVEAYRRCEQHIEKSKKNPQTFVQPAAAQEPSTGST